MTIAHVAEGQPLIGRFWIAPYPMVVCGAAAGNTLTVPSALLQDSHFGLLSIRGRGLHTHARRILSSSFSKSESVSSSPSGQIPSLFAMAACSATASCATSATCLVQKNVAVSSSRVAAPLNGLPALRMPRLVCSAQKKEEDVKAAAASAASFAAFVASNPGAALALVDERMSTEGTGLGLGLSNPQLIWVMVGTATLIWALFFVYSSGLPEGDDTSGLDL